MIKQFLTKNKIISSAIFSNKSFFSSGHHGPVPQKLQKAENTLIYLYIKNIDNVVQKVPAFQGQSLLDAIIRMRVRAFESNVCIGYDATYRPHVRPHDPFSDGPQCGGCRVVLQDNWFKRLNAQTQDMTEQQKHLLYEFNIDTQANTRLACCVPVQKWMNGMTLSVEGPSTQGGQAAIF